jgi:hypothetical protein
MRYAPRALLAGGLGFAVSALVACGGDSGLLSGDQSSNLNNQLDAVASAVNAGNCPGAATAVSGFSHVVGDLPASVSPILRANLIQGASTVGRLAATDCQTTTTHRTSTTRTSSSTQTSTSTTPTTSSTSSATSSTTTPTTSSTSSPTTTSSSETSTTSSGSSTGSGSGGAGLGGSGNGNSGGNAQ